MPIKVNSGVPQGSILGTLFFTLFSNELPEVINNTAINQLDPEPDVKQGWHAYQVEGGVQGDVCYYGDETTLSMSDTDPARLSAKLSTEYKEIAKYMVHNLLKLNDEKTHLQVMGSNNCQTTDQVRMITW